MLKPTIVASVLALTLASAAHADTSERARIDAAVIRYAAQHNVPESLVHRVIKRESGYRPHARNKVYYGLMQISAATAKSMGHTGDPKKLLEIDTNLAYAVPYLANAWRVSNGNQDKAMKLYASGFYYQAKAKGIHKDLRTAQSPSLSKTTTLPEQASAYARVEPMPQETVSFFGALFSNGSAATPRQDD